MLHRSRVRRSGALVVLTMLVVAGSADAGASAQASAPQPAAQQPAAEQVPGPAVDLPEPSLAPEPIYEPPPPLVEADAAADAVANVAPTSYDIDVPMNERVLAFVRLLSGRLKSFLEEGLSRGVQFLPMVQDVFRAEGLPLDLAYVPLVESAFKPTALSRAKARGMWQFMRGTGLENGLAHDWYIDERADPEKATYAAAKYLKTLGATFGGDWHLALASYNGGPGRVQRAVRRSGRTDFWQISASSRYLPRETRDYVPLVLAAIIIARNPAEYGLNVEPVAPPRTETVALPAALDLRRLSAWIGTPVEAIRGLNPELRQWTTPLRAASYELKIPEGTGDILRAHLDETDPADLTTIDWHTAKKGDTLASVAKKLKVTRAELAEANALSTRARLQVGQQLVIPRAPALPDLVQVASEPAAAESQYVGRVSRSRPGEVSVADAPASAGATAAIATADPPVARAVPASRVHSVRRGDTLFSIARLYRTTVAAIKGWNRLRTDSIQVGQRLRIFNERPTTATN